MEKQLEKQKTILKLWSAVDSAKVFNETLVELELGIAGLTRELKRIQVRTSLALRGARGVNAEFGAKWALVEIHREIQKTIPQDGFLMDDCNKLLSLINDWGFALLSIEESNLSEPKWQVVYNRLNDELERMGLAENEHSVLVGRGVTLREIVTVSLGDMLGGDDYV